MSRRGAGSQAPKSEGAELAFGTRIEDRGVPKAVPIFLATLYNIIAVAVYHRSRAWLRRCVVSDSWCQRKLYLPVPKWSSCANILGFFGRLLRAQCTDMHVNVTFGMSNCQRREKKHKTWLYDGLLFVRTRVVGLVRFL